MNIRSLWIVAASLGSMACISLGAQAEESAKAGAAAPAVAPAPVAPASAAPAAPAANQNQKEYLIDSANSPVSFKAVGKPGFLRINGEGSQLEGSASVVGDKFSGKFLTKLVSMKTGMGLRDTHMHEKYLETTKFPNAELQITDGTLSGKDPAKLSFTGDLTIKGVKKPVKGQGELKFSADGSKAEGEITFQAKLSDYPVGVPSHMGVTVAEDVEVKAVVQATKK